MTDADLLQLLRDIATDPNARHLPIDLQDRISAARLALASHVNPPSPTRDTLTRTGARMLPPPLSAEPTRGDP